MRFFALFLLSAFLPAVAAHARVSACALVSESGLRASPDACIQGHIFDVVTVANGTRFLDLCSPDTPDEGCRFSVVSYGQDRRRVGDLESLRGKDVSIRGEIQRFEGRYVLLLNDERQFHGATGRFTPDPRLLGSTAGEEDAVKEAPELRVNFHHHGRKLEKE